MKEAAVRAGALLQPGDTLGIVGGGQLARMLALVARRAQVRVAVQDPDPESPAAQVADRFFEGAWSDARTAQLMAQGCKAVTVDNEHVPAALLEQLQSVTEVRPGPSVLSTIQDRLTQRHFLAKLGVAQTPFRRVDSMEDLEAGLAELGQRGVLKSRFHGYDGRGQRSVDRASLAGQPLDPQELRLRVLEAFVDFEREVSVVLARAADGEMAYFPVVENEHRNHALLFSHAPASVDEALAKQAQQVAGSIAEALGHIGVLAVEFFVTRDGQLLVNEVAPRTHNSGHLTWGSCNTSQFEQHLRAVGGWRLGDPTQHSPAAMFNLYGDLWLGAKPDFLPVLRHPAAKLHLYGKGAARAGRKMGHVVILAASAPLALQEAQQLHRALTGQS